MKIGALVPARIGSKRLPRKNIKALGGRPLLCWTLDALLESGVFESVTVSTESDEVAAVVRERYAAGDVNVLSRPLELSCDDSSLSCVARHFLENRPDLDWYGLFMPTFPFRRVSKLHEAAYAVASGHALRVASVSDWEECLMDYYHPAREGVKRFAHEPALYCRLNFPAYEFRHRHFPEGVWKHYGLSVNEKVYLLHASRRELVDIDTPEDFELASALVHGEALVPARPVIHDIPEHGGWRAVIPEGVPLEPFLDWVGRERLADRTHPILILEEPFPPLSFLRVCDGSVRRYWMGAEEAEFFSSKRLASSGNMSYTPRHFKHVPHYRLARHAAPFNEAYPMAHDMDGHQAGLDYKAIPWERVLLLDDLKQQPFYRPGIVPQGAAGESA